MSEAENLHKPTSETVNHEDGQTDQLEDLQIGEVPPGEEVLQNEEPPKDKRSKKLIYALVALSAVVFTFALVAIFFAFQSYEAQEATEPSNLSAEDVIAGDGETVNTEQFLDGPIVVAHETAYIAYNANLDESRQVVDPHVGALVSVEVQEEGEVLVFPSGSDGAAAVVDAVGNAATAVGNAVSGAGNNNLGINYSNLRGIDVLEAQAMAQRAGYVVHQVFVVCPNVVNNGATPPPAGQVLDVQTYNMRGDGSRYMFLHVMTTEPVGNARAVPNLVGAQWQTGRDRLRGAGLGPRYVYERSSPDAKGRVLFQAPGTGSFTPRKSTVIMVLAD